MWEFLQTLFLSNQYIPHGHCYLWQTPLVVLHIVSDLLIAIAYFSIPVMLLYFIYKRQDIPFQWIFALFGAFIILCGTGHLMDIWTLWHPVYWLTGIEQAITALVSCYTALQMVTLLPQFLALKTPEQLEVLNQELQSEIAERQRAEESLRRVNDELEIRVSERTAELSATLHTLEAEIAVSEAALSKYQQTESALKRSNTRYQNLAANIPGMIYQFMLSPDKSMRFSYVSPGCREIFGLEPELIQEQLALSFGVIHPDDIASVQSAIAVSAKTLEPWHCVWRIIVQGKTKWLQGDSRPEKQADGSILWDGLLIDISERFQTEIELRKAKEAAEVANRAKSKFLANMSHELRTPLNAILGFTQVMSRDRFLSTEHRESLRIINHAGEHLLNLINEILEMSKIEAGRITLNESSFDLYSLLYSLSAILQLKATSKGLQLIFDIDPHIPQFIRADETKLRQVLMNVLGNAIKFTTVGSVTLRVKGGQESEITPRRLFFEVEDTGCGIASEEFDLLFEAFGQTEAGRKSHQGTGLGLPISQKYVQLMGGDISVHSTLDQGTLFVFDIPVSLAETTDIQTTQPQQKVIGLAPNQPEYRILVVDDSFESRLLLVKLFTSIGFSVQEAENGQQAIALWESWEPHLIWMDMQMPVMNGYEATKQIKATPKGQATLIIAFTASAFEEDRQIVLSAGCDDFVCKPFQERVLLEKVTQHLGIKYTYEEDRRQNTEKVPTITDLVYHLRQMSAEWVEEVDHAAAQCSDDLILELIEQIPPEGATLANALTELAGNFQFEKIMELIRAEAG